MRASTRLRELLKGPDIIVAPGAYDGFSARLVEAAGFKAAYMTGAGTAASEYRTDPALLIIARTDARAVTGLDDAIERGNRYAEAGADVIFVEAPQGMDEVQRIAREVKAPLLANMVPGGKTPAVKFSDLQRLGFRIVIYPAVCMGAAVAAIERALARLRERETDWEEGPVLAPMDIFKKVGFDWWNAIERKFAGRT